MRPTHAATPGQNDSSIPGRLCTKAEAKRELLLSDSDLKKLESTKRGGKLLFAEALLRKRAHAKHGGPSGLAKALATAKRFATKVNGKTLEQHRRALGDEVKSRISVEKWCVAAQTHAVTQCPFEVFEALVIPNVFAGLDMTSPYCRHPWHPWLGRDSVARGDRAAAPHVTRTRFEIRTPEQIPDKSNKLGARASGGASPCSLCAHVARTVTSQ